MGKELELIIIILMAANLFSFLGLKPREESLYLLKTVFN